MSEGRVVRRDLLLRLADLLEADAKEAGGIKFDMSLWGMTSAPLRIQSCATTGCAMGLAAMSGHFKDDGLYADIAVWDGPKRTYAPDATHYIKFLLNGKDRKEDGIQVAEEFFGLSYEEATWLFHPAGYIGEIKGAEGELHVAKRIKEFVDRKSGPYIDVNRLKSITDGRNRRQDALDKIRDILNEF